jgi:two-component system cell cycle sensor histidine kinase/response regulator CckA
MTAPDKTVLVVEDEDVVRRVVVNRLRKAGYQVLEAADGKKALEMVDQQTPVLDLVVTDVIMPLMNGRQMAAELHKRLPGLTVLYMSGYPQDVIAHHGILEPGINFLDKSLISEQLLPKVRDLLDSSPPWRWVGQHTS